MTARTPKLDVKTLALMLVLVLVASVGLAYVAFSIFHVDGPPPARAEQLSQPAERVRSESARPAPATHVIRPGESLWSIAQDRLGRRASDADVLDEVRRIRRANRGALSKDPDLARPGLKLRLP